MPKQVARRKTGQFKKGVSGNPHGRPKGSKNLITEAKMDLELALRQNVRVEQVRQIVNKMCDLAVEGNVAAAKLILDKTISNARVEDDPKQQGQQLRVIIENATFGASQPDKPDALEGEYTEIDT